MDTKNSRFVQGLVSVSSSTLLRLVLGFISLTVAARSLIPDELGVYFLMITIVYLLEVIGDFGQNMAAARFVASAETESERDQIIETILAFRAFTVIPLAVIAIALKPLWLFFFPSDLLSSLFLFVPLLFIVQIMEGTFANIMQGQHLYRETAIVRAITGVLNFSMVMLLVLMFGWGTRGLILANIISTGIAMVIRYRMIPGNKRLRYNAQRMRKLLGFGTQLQGNEVLTFIFQRVDVLILGALIGPAQIALLEVGARIPNYFQQLFHAVNAVYLPHMSELFGQGEPEEAEFVLNTFLRLAAFLMLGCTLTLIVFARDVIVLIFDETYLPSVPVLGILMVVITISLISQILDIALVSSGKPIYLLIINTVTMIASISADVTLIPAFGLMGVVAARLFANTVALPVSIHYVWKMKIQANMLTIIKPILIFSGCLALYFILQPEMFILKIGILLLYPMFSLAFSVITPEEVLYVPRRIKYPIQKLAVEQ